MNSYWGEYVYQGDLTEELYEITTTAYELVDYLLDHPEIDIPELLRPFIDKIRKEVEPDIRQTRKERCEDGN